MVLKGISKEKYEASQAVKEEADFRFNTNQSLQSHKFTIEILSDICKENSEIIKSIKSDISSNFQQFVKSCVDSLDAFSQEIGDLRDQIKEINSSLDLMKEVLAGFIKQKDFLIKEEAIYSQFKIIRQEIDNFKNDISNNTIQISSRMDQKISNAKKEILERPSELPDFKKHLDQKIELCELNGQNALVRSSNNERQLQIIERKIENIYQLIKEIKLLQG